MADNEAKAQQLSPYLETIDPEYGAYALNFVQAGFRSKLELATLGDSDGNREFLRDIPVGAFRVIMIKAKAAHSGVGAASSRGGGGAGGGTGATVVYSPDMYINDIKSLTTVDQYDGGATKSRVMWELEQWDKMNLETGPREACPPRQEDTTREPLLGYH